MAKQSEMKKPKRSNSKEAIAARFPPSYQFHWRAGPYHAPTVSVGGVLHDEWRGDLTVDGFTKAPIPWPGVKYQHSRGDAQFLPVLCGDLVRAVCEEDELTVSHYWGVTRYVVEQWKRAISRATDANAVRIGLAFKRQNPAFRKKFGYQ
jgi:hypothetical protein